MSQATLPAPLIDALRVAEIFGVPRLRVYELARSGVLKSVKIGKNVRFRPEDIAEFVESGGAGLRDG
jgi:excisionase family DNA binding protein